MKRIGLIILYALACLPFGYTQSRVVTGRVTDEEKGTPLPGVSISVKGDKTGTATGADGKFSISAPARGTLVFSSVGYTTKEEAINGRTEMDIVLTAENAALNEVVVVGYGKEKKINVIGSVATVSGKDIVSAPVSSVSNSLAGRLPGAIVQQRSGEPGADAASILIRGASTLGNASPLVIIDGIPGRDANTNQTTNDYGTQIVDGSAGRDLNSINPEDIESISVLKDASAAIYGARAANGVILITTKRGKTDSPPNFSYSFYTGFLSPISLPKMADAATYAQMLREMETYKGVDPSNLTYTAEDVEKFKSGKYPWTHPNTDWFGITLKDHSKTQNHNFSVNGGTKTVNYFVSFGTQYADGIYRDDNAKKFNRYNLRANIDIKINKYLNVGLDMDGSQENRMGPSLDAQTIFNVINQNKPTRTSTFPNGMPGTGAFGASYQPLLRSTLEGGFDDDKRYRSNNKINALLKIPGVEGLTVSSYFAYDIFFGKRKYFDHPVTGYTLDKAGYLAAGNDGSEDGSAFLIASSDNYDPQLTNSYNNTAAKTFNARLNYDKTINDAHNISAFIAYESSESNGIGITAFRRYFNSTQLPYLFAGGDELKDNSEYVTLDARVNYFGRISYNYKQTYLLQFAFRRDGSLRFSKESGRWGNFPSVLAGWVLSNEKFWSDNVKFMDYLKLKASWGRLGNDLVPPFQYLASYAYGTGGVFGTNGSYLPGLYQSNAPNPYITWEVANVYNVGFESQMFDHRLTFNADFFYQRRNNILIKRNASVPAFTGIVLPDQNFGIVENRGFEVELGYNGKVNKDFAYSINGNVAFARNKIVEFDEPPVTVPWQKLTGHPMEATLLYESAGIFRDVDQVNKTPHVSGAIPGDVIIKDQNGDNVIDESDRIIYDKTTNPEVTYGISLNLRYKGFGLSALVNGAGTAWVRMLGSQQGSAGDYYQFHADGRWTPDNIDATKPRAYDGFSTYWRGKYPTDLEYQNQNYARLKNVQISYTFPRSVFKLDLIREIQLYVSGQNLCLIYSSKNRIWDPEFSGVRDNYPLMRVMSLGARVSFQ
ncbi:MAG: TonB-dependent receptor [Chitinophagaceae bacterium]|nr:TonB-dependent receptor [Chitinophagaceae bacterium]